MREKSVEQKIVEKIKRKGGLCLKWVSPGYTGVPDRIAILPGGRILFIEVKRPGTGRLSPRQRRVGDLLRSLGCSVIVADETEDLDGYI